MKLKQRRLFPIDLLDLPRIFKFMHVILRYQGLAEQCFLQNWYLNSKYGRNFKSDDITSDQSARRLLQNRFCRLKVWTKLEVRVYSYNLRSVRPALTKDRNRNSRWKKAISCSLTRLLHTVTFIEGHIMFLYT